jgi:acyl-CoA thioester hydrolase
MRYHRPARLDDLLHVTAQILDLGRVTLTLQQQAWQTTAGQPTILLCEGTIRIGWVDTTTMRPGRVPAPVIEALKTP